MIWQYYEKGHGTTLHPIVPPPRSDAAYHYHHFVFEYSPQYKFSPRRISSPPHKPLLSLFERLSACSARGSSGVCRDACLCFPLLDTPLGCGYSPASPAKNSVVVASGLAKAEKTGRDSPAAEIRMASRIPDDNAPLPLDEKCLYGKLGTSPFPANNDVYCSFAPSEAGPLFFSALSHTCRVTTRRQVLSCQVFAPPSVHGRCF
eukprot:293213-Rhodomonas_salina.1